MQECGAGVTASDDRIMAPTHSATLDQLDALLNSTLDRTWRLEVARSTLSGAGSGLFVRGSCPADAVVAVYPGVFFRTEDLAVMHKIVLPGNEYVMMRRDGVLVDGRPDGTSQQLFQVAEQRDVAAGRPPLICDGEHMVGNMANHPPQGTPPNVYAHPLDLRADELPHLHAHIPVVAFRPPAVDEHVIQTVVLVTARAVADEELYLDYKLRREGPLEAWYSPAVSAATSEPPE